jgi:hypothetical protein
MAANIGAAVPAPARAIASTGDCRMRDANLSKSRRSRSTARGRSTGAAGAATRTARSHSGRAESVRLDHVPAIPWRRIPGNVLLGFLVADLVFVLIYLAGIVMGFAGHGTSTIFYLVDIDGEGNITAWYSGMQMLLVGLVLLALATRLFAADARVWPLRRLFLVAGLGFVFFSADEIGEIHEFLSSWIARHVPLLMNTELRVARSLGFHHLTIRGGGGAWIAIYAVIGAVTLYLLAPQIRSAWQIWPRQSRAFVVGFGTLFVGGAVVEVFGFFFRQDTTGKYLETAIKQGVDFVGTSIALFAATWTLCVAAERLSRRSRESLSPDAAVTQPLRPRHD